MSRLGGAFLFAVIVLSLVWLIRWLVVAVFARGHWVYEIDTEDGSLLYVGECGNVAKRMRSHRAYQARLPEGHPRKWWPDADPAVQVNLWPSRATWYRSKAIAVEVQNQRIRQKNPIANQVRYKGYIRGGGD